MRGTPLTVLLAAAVVAWAAAPAHAGLISSFESGIDGFNAQNDATTTTSAVGVTDGAMALQIDRTAGGWVAVAQKDGTSTLNQLQGNGMLMADVTAFSNEVDSTYLQLIFVVQGDGQGWTQSDNTASYDQNVVVDGQPHTMSWDYSAALPSLPTSPTWWQFILVMNNDAPTAGNTVTLHVDNIRTGPVPEPASLGLLGLGALALLRRRH